MFYYLDLLMLLFRLLCLDYMPWVRNDPVILDRSVLLHGYFVEWHCAPFTGKSRYSLQE